MITDDAFPVEPWQIRETMLRPRPARRRPSRCSRCPTGTSGCAATSTRASRTACPAPTSTGSTRSVRCRTPRPATATPRTGQTIVNVTNGKLIRLLVDDEPFDVRYGELLAHERTLDLRAGTLHPRRRVELAGGQAGQGARPPGWCRSRSAGLAAIEYEVEAVDDRAHHAAVRAGRQRGPAAAVGRSARRGGAGEPARAGAARGAATRGALLDAPHPGQRADGGRGDGPRRRGPRPGRHQSAMPGTTGRGPPWSCGLQAGERLRIVKYLAYGWSSLRSRPALRDQVAAALAGARYSGWQGLLDAQRDYLDDFWDSADVEVEGDPELPAGGALRAVPRAAGQRPRRAPRHRGQGAHRARLRRPRVLGHRGLRAAGAHLHRAPRRRRRAALAARRRWTWRAPRAGELDLAGAAFPWRTIRGEECSAYWPAGTAAFHVNADHRRRPSSATAW